LFLLFFSNQKIEIPSENEKREREREREEEIERGINNLIQYLPTFIHHK
jgi:hypothetical protein